MKLSLKYIEDESSSVAFQDLFSEINLSSDHLGKKYLDHNAKLCIAIAATANGLSAFCTDVDTLGNA